MMPKAGQEVHSSKMAIFKYTMLCNCDPFGNNIIGISV